MGDLLMHNTRIDVLGVGFDDVTVEQAVLRAFEKVDGGERFYVVTPNPEIVWRARRDEPLRNAINRAGLVLPDGVGIIIGAKILGTPIRGGRAPGIDFASAMLERMSNYGGSVFLLGAKAGVAELAGQKLIEKHTGINVAGAADGYFTDDAQVVEAINTAQPDFLLVCLGSPKQELWMERNIDRLNVKMCVGLGGALDVFAGKVKRAPAFFLKLGLEWFYRLVKEPRRIKRMIKLPIFVLAVIWRRIWGN